MTWAVVTGATARGGEAIARALHGAGIDVVIHHSERSRDRAMLLRDELRANGADAVTWEADLAQPVIVPPWVRQLNPAYCVCNASVYQPSEVGDSARAQLDLAVHLHANVAILTALQGTLRSVVAVTDVHVERPAGGFVWYTVSKAALQSLLLNLAIEWAPRIRCNIVAPGTLPFPASWDDRAKMDTIGQSIPLGRVGDFGDLAGAVRYLLLEANYVTGQVLVVDGGRSRWLSG